MVYSKSYSVHTLVVVGSSDKIFCHERHTFISLCAMIYAFTWPMPLKPNLYRYAIKLPKLPVLWEELGLPLLLLNWGRFCQGPWL